MRQKGKVLLFLAACLLLVVPSVLNKGPFSRTLMPHVSCPDTERKAVNSEAGRQDVSFLVFRSSLIPNSVCLSSFPFMTDKETAVHWIQSEEITIIISVAAALQSHCFCLHGQQEQREASLLSLPLTLLSHPCLVISAPCRP